MKHAPIPEWNRLQIRIQSQPFGHLKPRLITSGHSLPKRAALLFPRPSGTLVELPSSGQAWVGPKGHRTTPGDEVPRRRWVPTPGGSGRSWWSSEKVELEWASLRWSWEIPQTDSI